MYGEYKLTQTFLEGNLTIHILKSLLKYKSFDPAIALLGLSFREIIKDVHKYIYMSMVQHMLLIAKNTMKVQIT